MKILIDVDELERKGMLTPELATRLRESAGQDVKTTAINLVLGFGAVAVAAGLMALVQSTELAAALGLAFLVGGYLAQAASPRQWNKLGSIWMVLGALTLATSIGALLDRPLAISLIAAAIFFSVGLLAESHLLIGPPVTKIAVREPTLTILLFSALAFATWRIALAYPAPLSNLALTFARVSVVLFNFGFWVGSLWGDTPGQLWTLPESSEWSPPEVPAVAFAAAWALAIVAAGFWGGATRAGVSWSMQPRRSAR